MEKKKTKALVTISGSCEGSSRKSFMVRNKASDGDGGSATIVPPPPPSPPLAFG